MSAEKILKRLYDNYQNGNEWDKALKDIELYATTKEKQAYIAGTNSCHEAFQPLLKSALKHQRYLCADEIKYDPEVESSIIDDFKDNVINAPEPPKEKKKEECEHDLKLVSGGSFQDRFECQKEGCDYYHH